VMLYNPAQASVDNEPGANYTETGI
jgi:hypothetical protein